MSMAGKLVDQMLSDITLTCTDTSRASFEATAIHYSPLPTTRISHNAKALMVYISHEIWLKRLMADDAQM